MITVGELSQWLKEGTVQSSREVELTIYPYHKGTALKLSECRNELFISETRNFMCFHQAYSVLHEGHPFRDRCYFVRPSEVKSLGIGIKV